MKRATGPMVPEEEGALFEGLVAQLLRAHKNYASICDDIFYWVPSGRTTQEVDFILIH